MSNEKKSATLGMSHGTAVHRLRKNIMFSLIKRLNEDICFKCKKPIEFVDELSVEHKLPWEGISAELFWDLENIAFSHLRCNVPHKNGGGGVYRPRPEGMNWCSVHQKFESVENFWKEPRKRGGLRYYCKDGRPDRPNKRNQSACGEKANAEDLKSSAPNELAGSNPA